MKQLNRFASVTAFAGAVIAALSMFGSQVAAQESEASRLSMGRITFQLSCAVCHGPDAKGEGAVAGYLSVPAPDLTALARRNGGSYPAERVRRIIEGGEAVTTHVGQMPAWGLLFLKDFEGDDGRTSDAATLVRRRIDDLVTYLGSLQSK